MRKFLFAAMALLAFTAGANAQTVKVEKKKVTTEKKVVTQPKTAVKTKSTVETKKTTNGVVLKKDGTPDRRYKQSKKLKKDGTPDMRYKENKTVKKTVEKK